MLIIILCWLSINNYKFSKLLENVSEFSEKVQQSCLSYLPNSSKNTQAYAALLCGKNITEENTKEKLIKSSLIHLFVVSGSHLILIEDCLLKIGIPFFLRFLIMGAYGLACGWQAPIVRAWLGLCSRMISKKWYLFLPADYFVFVVGMICLMLFPDWISSRSLIMSWLAAMALAICSLLRIRNVPTRLLAQSTVIYLMMMPALWGFGNLHPLSIVFNIVLAPLVSFVLLPLALISSVITSWVPAFDKICDIFFWISTQGTEPIELVKAKPLDVSTLWIFIFISHVCIHFLRVYLLRNKEI